MRHFALAAVSICLLLGHAAAETPAQRAKLLLEAQLAPLRDTTKPLAELVFDPEAVVFGIGGGQQIKDLSTELYQLFGGGSPHSFIKKAKVLSLVAGGSDAAVWWTAEVAITIRNQEP